MLKFFGFSFIFILSTFFFPLLSYADSVGLIYQQKPIHPGCIKELMTELNGDQVVAAINLGTPSLRSSLDSNRYWMKSEIREMSGKMLAFDTEAKITPQEDHKPEWFGYRDVGEVGGSIHYLALCSDSSEGTIGRTCQGLFVKITSDPILVVEDKSSVIHEVDRVTLVGISSHKILTLPEAKKAVEILQKRKPSSECTVGTQTGCQTGEICMSSIEGGKCTLIPNHFPVLLSAPFAKTEKLICTHSSGDGSHSWPNAFYAIDLATPYESSAATIYAAEDGKAFIFQGDNGLPCA